MKPSNILPNFVSQFGGNPVSCAIALSVLDVIDKEGLRQNALEVGEYLMRRGRELMQEYTIIGDVRGLGLFSGFDLVRNRRTREPATEEAKYIVKK